MAFVNGIGNALRRTSGSTSSPLFLPVRCMSSRLFVGVPVYDGGDGKWIPDSDVITQVIDKKYRTPSLITLPEYASVFFKGALLRTKWSHGCCKHLVQKNRDAI